MVKIFLVVLKRFAHFGVVQHRHPVNVRSVSMLFMDSCCIISCGAYIYIEAQSFQEYAESIFMATAVMAKTSIFIVSLLKMQQIFDYINDAEQIIDGSKIHSIDSL